MMILTDMDFCPSDCFYLGITEPEQRIAAEHQPHVCRKYNTRLYHLLDHPRIHKCEECKRGELIIATRIKPDLCADDEKN